jgi:hypothetical protein
MAWGGQRHDHGRLAWNARQHIQKTMEAIQRAPNRKEAYNICIEAKARKALPGIGPAYFTKLIYFLRPFSGPPNDGYIMDQWTARSVNLLTKSRLVRLQWTKSKNGRMIATVRDDNTGEIYEKFCREIEAIAKKLALDPSECEQRMMCVGGRSPGLWRDYVHRTWADQ